MSNYFLGNDPAKWRTNVPHYARVRYEEVYPGIDLVYYGNQQQLEYDFLVAPGADPDQVRLAFEGAGRLEVDAAGDLLLHTAGGTVRQHRPVVYQKQGDARQPVEGDYRLLADGGVRFEVGAYDRGKPLVIDPVLTYSTFLGGSGADSVSGVAVDNAGAVYVTGRTASVDFPLVGALQPGYGGGPFDAFVCKLNPTGTALVYATFLGGSSSENVGGGYGNFRTGGIAVDGGGSAYVCGATRSGNFPTTPDAFDATLAGYDDGFVAKLSPGGDVLVYSTYLGGSGTDAIADLTVDPSGTAYVTGSTASDDFPVTPGAFQPPRAGDRTDAFVTRIGATGSSLLYSSYLGGTHDDFGHGVAVDDSGCAYVTGATTSDDFPVTPGSFDTTLGGDIPGYGADVFVAKVNSAGTGLIYATFIGAAGDDSGLAIAVDVAGSAYVTGWAQREFPATAGAFDTSLDGVFDAFVLKLSPPGSDLVYSTFLGGGLLEPASAYDVEAGTGIAVGRTGAAYVIGHTTCRDFPLWQPLQPDRASLGIRRDGDAFVTGLAPDGSALTFSTYLGGGVIDSGMGICAGEPAAIYVAGDSFGGFPTANPLQPFRGHSDIFLAKIEFAAFPPPTDLTVRTFSTDRAELSWRDNSSGETAFLIERRLRGDHSYWAFAFGAIASTGSNVTRFTDTTVGRDTYVYRVRAVGPAGYSGYTNNAAVVMALQPPSSLTATPVSSTQLRLEWRDGTPYGGSRPTHFLIEGKAGHPSDPGDYAELGRTAWGTTFRVLSGLEPGIYTFRVRAAILLQGHPPYYSEYSNEATVALLVPPGELTATTLSGSAVRLAWTDRSTGEAGFRIERRTGSAPFTVVAAVGGDQTGYTDIAVSEATTYVYRVRAYASGGESLPSNEATASTPLNQPTDLAGGSLSGRKVRLTWTDGSVRESGYQIERKTGTGAFTLAGTTGANVTAFTDSGLTPLTAYTYRVRAVSAGNTSPYSNEAAVTTLADVPEPPSALALAVSTGVVQLRWSDNSSNETGFKVERRNGGSYSEVAVLPANSRAFTDRGLTSGGTYLYRVRAYNANGSSLYSNEAQAILTGPPAPSSAVAAAVWGTRIRLTWQDNSSGEYGFRIERRAGAAGSFTQIRVVSSNVTELLDTGLTPGTQYAYRLRAYNGIATSVYSNTATAATPSPPAAPSQLAAALVSSTRIRLVWRDNSPDETGFRLERKAETGSWAELRVVGPNTTSFVDAGAAPGTAYTYRVRAYGPGGFSAYSNEAQAISEGIPAAPSALALTVSTGIVQLRWQDNSNNERGFKVERRSGSGSYSEVSVVPAGSRAFTDRGLTGGDPYTYRVRAYNAAGDSPYSNEATAVLAGPPAPSNATAVAVWGTRVRLTWQDNSSGEYGFRIERKTGSAGSFAEMRVVSSNVTELLDTGLAVGTTYTYRVRAYNGIGTSPYSNEATAVTPAPPAAPRSLTATVVSSTWIRLAWQDGSTNETGFRLERRAGTGDWVEFRTVPANSTRFENVGLTPSTSYTYRVRAYGPGGMSGYSNEAAATTPP